MAEDMRPGGSQAPCRPGAAGRCLNDVCPTAFAVGRDGNASDPVSQAATLRNGTKCGGGRRKGQHVPLSPSPHHPLSFVAHLRGILRADGADQILTLNRAFLNEVREGHAVFAGHNCPGND